MRRWWRRSLALVVPLLLAANCNGVVVPPEPPPEADIGIRVVDGVGEFYLRETGERFIPRGHNYVKMVLLDDPILGEVVLDAPLSTLVYDPAEVRADFQAMSSYGFNVVRVFLETCSASGCISEPGGKLEPAYMDNVVDFMQIAKEEGIYVWLSSNTLPDVGYYPEQAFVEGESDFLTTRNVDLPPVLSGSLPGAARA